MHVQMKKIEKKESFFLGNQNFIIVIEIIKRCLFLYVSK